MSHRSFNRKGKKGDRNSLALHQNSALPGPSTLSRDGEILDAFSQDDIFSLKVEELNELINTLKHLESESSQIQDSPRSSYLSDSSIRKNEEHSDILEKKRLFTSKLTDAALLSYNEPVENSKCMIQSYKKLALLVKEQCNRTNQEVELVKEDLKRLDTETNTIQSQIDTFTKILETVHYEENEKHSKRADDWFREAKTTLGTLLSTFFSEKKKAEFISAVTPMIEAFTSNMDDKEKQYVEIPTSTAMSKPMKYLIDAFIIISHPSKPGMYRFCMED